MAATCQERGIKHVKDVFIPPKGTKHRSNSNQDGNTEGFFFGMNMPGKSDSSLPKNAQNNNKPGGFLLRSGKNKDINIMEVPVPTPHTNERNKKESDSREKDTYLSPKSVQKGRRSSSSSSEASSRKYQAPLPPPIAVPPPPPPMSSPRPLPPTGSPPPPPMSSPPLPPTGSPPPPPMSSPPLPPTGSPPPPPPPPPMSMFLPMTDSPPLPPPPTGFPPSPPPRPPTPPTPPPPPSSAAPLPPPPPFAAPPPPTFASTISPPKNKSSATSPTSPGYTQTIVADVHHQMDAKENDSFENEYLRTSQINRQLSGEYQTGSLINGRVDDDGDVLSNVDIGIFGTANVLIGDSPHSASKQSSKSTENSFNVKKASESRNGFKGKGSPKKEVRRSSMADTETESSLLTGSDHGAASSGYQSELSTDSERTTSPAFKSPTTINESASSFEEDECTLDFDDDGFVEGKNKKIYHEYQGEDFSKYLQDDDYTTSTTTLTRRVQKHKQHHQPKSQAVAPNRRYAVQNPKKPGIKDKITQAFTLTRSDRKKHEAPTSQPKTKIQNFSFMTSKMGMYASEEELNQYMTKDMETKSDIGGVKKSAEVPSWYKDTLSASTLRRAKNALDQKSFSSSVPNLTEAEQYRTLPNGDGVQNGRYRGESLSEFGADIKKKKKVNRFKFWKGLGKKGKKNKESSQNFEPECVDIKL